MKAKEFIIELFDKTVKWSTDSYGDSRFDVNGIEFYVEFTQIGNDTLSIIFSDTSDDSIEITGKMGNESLVVLSTVAKIILQTISSRKPEHFKFTADRSEPSRVSLYRRLAKKLPQLLPYSLEIGGEYGEETFKFTKNNEAI